MTAPHSEELRQERHTNSGIRVRQLAQQEALERLIALLDMDEEQILLTPMATYRWDDSLHRLARLRQARASNALATTSDLVRVGPGAWILRRHV